MAKNKTLQATQLNETMPVRLHRRGRIVAWVSGLGLAGIAAWGLWLPESAPDFFTWPPAQLVILLSAAQTIIQINIDQGKGLVRIGPERTRVWRVGGFPRRYDSSRVSISTDAEKGHVLVDDRPLGRLDLFDIKGAIELR